MARDAVRLPHLQHTLCSFVFGWLIGWPIALVFAAGAIYGFTALGDSPVLSTAFTEAVRPAYLGSGLALRSLLGFGAGAIAPLVFGRVLDSPTHPRHPHDLGLGLRHPRPRRRRRDVVRLGPRPRAPRPMKNKPSASP